MITDIRGVRVNGTLHKIDYEYLANRPFGVETRGLYLAEQSDVPFSPFGSAPTKSGTGPAAQITEPMQLLDVEAPVIGENYIITWDGVEYESTCSEPNFGDGASLGDYAFETAPFYMVFGPSSSSSSSTVPSRDLTQGIELYIYTTDTDSSHTFKIEHYDCTRIDPKYLPAYLAYGAETRTEVMPETEAVFESAFMA